MPHFVIDCSQNILNKKAPNEIIQIVYNTAEASGLFEEGDIKVRINPFEYYTIGNTRGDFIHVFANIMEGRSIPEKNDLSKKIVSELKSLLPEVPIISMNIRDFEKATYYNKSMVG
ncbi:5-carboxymethyl-2-hydroxymuconate Delta-isomerase [Arenibacter sp. M-2]|uniref:5-carboxymethyl-2-hydroxymuconate Delta-isomerase n=1 Tax=unclassified Arenibacter TaxID=2615047 RepID=UPI000D75B9D6|nr:MULTISPECIES: 5-carboxymethyl-2-hydroxymuconate Delta-isomerase [unclassified Arenibacter]MDL5512230.1 5-carboxymethyl-2-hydroxymuconate Delta-isomerase [Arenibacter sp. M-2]PXX26478.1 5-carboxymethyl-2-hydroxymuconate isomerase [Arenibacter sp. ARW7G5Y1]|tara:strand:+ start:33251 stop:33598 length:348 start_codon:yes stop_codon:yes gene_type:complete